MDRCLGLALRTWKFLSAVHGLVLATGDGETRTPVRRSGSKRRAAPGLVVGFRAFAGRVEPPGTDVGLNLSVPFLGDITLKSLREAGKLLFGEARNGCFEFLNAHVGEITTKTAQRQSSILQHASERRTSNGRHIGRNVLRR
jgi:hypothetical protein